MTHKEIYKEVSKLHTLYNERDRIAACEGAMMIMKNHQYLKEFAMEVVNAQRKKDIEKAWTFIKRNCYNSATLESKFRKTMED